MSIRLRQIAHYFSSRRLRLLILPTEKCNFRCTYCYEDFALGQMSSETVDAIAALVESRAADLDALEVDWFGGEPLLARTVVYRLSEIINDLAGRFAFGYVGTITTNGYLLTPDVARELSARGVTRFQVSLDGPEEIHDARRPTVRKQPTYQVIAGNIAAILDSDLDVHLQLRVHFDRATYPSVRDFVRDVVATWSRDARVEVLLTHVENLSDSQDGHVPQMEPAERTAAVSELKMLVGRGINKADAFYVCYAAQPNAFVIRADGRIGKCTVALKDEKNVVGRLTHDGQLQLNDQQLLPWFAGWGTGNLQQLACPYSAIRTDSCAGCSSLL